MMNTHFYQALRFLFRTRCSAFVMAFLGSCAVFSTACAPSSREAEARAIDAVRRLGGTIGQDPEDQGELVAKVDLTGSSFQTMM